MGKRAKKVMPQPSYLKNIVIYITIKLLLDNYIFYIYTYTNITNNRNKSQYGE